MMRPSLVEWLKSSKYAHLLESTDGLEWLYDYDCWYSVGTVLLIRGYGDWLYREVVIHTAGSITDNEIEDFGFAECYAVLEGGEVGVGTESNRLEAEMMTKKQKKLMSELRCVAEGPVAWDFANVDVDAIKLALAEIERLTQKNADLKSKLERESTDELTRKIAELATLCVDAQCEAIRLKRKVNTLLDARLNGGMLLGKDDVKKEVIE